MDKYIEDMIEQEDRQILKMREEEANDAENVQRVYDEIDMKGFANQQVGILTANKWDRHGKELIGGNAVNELNFMKSQIFDSSKKLETTNSLKDLDKLID